MKKFTLGLATVGTFAALTVGLAARRWLGDAPHASFEPAALQCAREQRRHQRRRELVLS